MLRVQSPRSLPRPLLIISRSSPALVHFRRAMSKTALQLSTRHVVLLPQEEVAQNQRVHLRPEKAFERLLRAADDGLILVEGGVKQSWHAGQYAETVDEPPIERVGAMMYRLQPARAVDMRHRRNMRALVVPEP